MADGRKDDMRCGVHTSPKTSVGFPEGGDIVVGVEAIGVKLGLRVRVHIRVKICGRK